MDPYSEIIDVAAIVVERTTAELQKKLVETESWVVDTTVACEKFIAEKAANAIGRVWIISVETLHSLVKNFRAIRISGSIGSLELLNSRRGITLAHVVDCPELSSASLNEWIKVDRKI